jgi:zinc protease
MAESLDPRTGVTVFAICNPQNVKKVETAIHEEIERLVKGGITSEELDQARRGYLQQQQVARTNDAFLASKLGDTAFAGRTMAYYADLEKKIAALTAADVSAALKKHLDPNRFSIVTAGDFEKAKAAP